jgi:hypothetical protein
MNVVHQIITMKNVVVLMKHLGIVTTGNA